MSPRRRIDRSDHRPVTAIAIVGSVSKHHCASGKPAFFFAHCRRILGPRGLFHVSSMHTLFRNCILPARLKDYVHLCTRSGTVTCCTICNTTSSNMNTWLFLTLSCLWPAFKRTRQKDYGTCIASGKINCDHKLDNTLICDSDGPTGFVGKCLIPLSASCGEWRQSLAHKARRAIRAAHQRLVDGVVAMNDPDAVHVAQAVGRVGFEAGQK